MEGSGNTFDSIDANKTSTGQKVHRIIGGNSLRKVRGVLFLFLLNVFQLEQ